MSPVDNSTSAPASISHSASARLPLLARNPGAPSLSYPSLARRRAMHQIPFVPRPFPPPALADVPLEYIVDQLRRLAPHYWNRPETSDCTIGTSTILVVSYLHPKADLPFYSCVFGQRCRGEDARTLRHVRCVPQDGHQLRVVYRFVRT